MIYDNDSTIIMRGDNCQQKLVKWLRVSSDDQWSLICTLSLEPLSLNWRFDNWPGHTACSRERIVGPDRSTALVQNISLMKPHVWSQQTLLDVSRAGCNDGGPPWHHCGVAHDSEKWNEMRFDEILRCPLLTNDSNDSIRFDHQTNSTQNSSHW